MTKTKEHRTPRTRWIDGGILAVALLAMAAWGGLALRENPTTDFDDAYMFLRYAKNFLAGDGVAWNPGGPPVYGTTSLLHFAVVTALWAVFPGADPGGFLVAVSLVTALLGLGFLVLGCRRLSRSRLLGSRLVLPAAVVPVFLASSTFLFHATSGMDTALGFAANGLLILAGLRWIARPGPGSLALVVVAAYLSFSARPDNLLHATFFPLVGMALLGERGGRRRWRNLAAYAVALGAVLAVDTAVKVMVFGGALPLSFYAKRSGFYEGYVGYPRWNPVAYLFEILRLVAPFLVAVALFVTRRSARLVAALLAPAALTWAYYFSVVQIMAQKARFYVPSTPFLAVAAVLVVDRYVARADGWDPAPGDDAAPRGTALEGARVRLLRGAAVAALVLASSSALVEGKLVSAWAKYGLERPAPVESSTVTSTAAESPLPSLDWWTSIQAFGELARQLPAGTRVAMSEHGLVAALAPQIEVIDMVGLHDPYFAHRGFDVDELLGREPDLIWFPHPDYTRMIAELWDAEALWGNYDVYPDAFGLGLAIRRRAPQGEDIAERVELAWRSLYGALQMEDYRAVPAFDVDPPSRVSEVGTGEP
ncbi:MAG: hypothetical protein AAGN66_24155 [Acidobacteriota bacterium]